MANGCYTGYIHRLIDENQSFEQYAWSVARGFGALVTMRDDDADAPIPQKLEPSELCITNRDEARTEVEKWSAMSEDDRIAWAIEDRNWKMADATKTRDEEAAEFVKLTDMLATVSRFPKIDGDHDDYRNALIQYVHEAVQRAGEVSYGERRLRELEASDPERYAANRKFTLSANLSRAEVALAEELSRVASRNQWIDAIRTAIEKFKNETPQ